MAFHTAVSQGDGWHAGSKKGWPGSPDQGGTYCQWSGIKCDEHGNVIEIALAGVGLQGNLSSAVPSIVVLPKIQKIDLSGNKNEATNCTGIVGGWPADIDDASISLQTIQLQQNGIKDKMPSSLGRLINLDTLDLHYNFVYGPLMPLPDLAGHGPRRPRRPRPR